MQKLNILLILLSVNLALLLGNIIVPHFSKEEPVTPPKNQITNLDSLLIIELFENGLKEEWIDERITFQKEPFYNITVPNDLSITTLLRNLNHKLKDSNLEVKTNELIENGKTKYEIFENEDRKSLYFFFYDDSLERESTELSFLIRVSNEEKLSTELLNASIPLTFLINIHEGADSIIAQISESSHKYFVYLDDEIDEEKYVLNLEFSKIRLRAIVENICNAFEYCQYFVIDNNSILARSNLFEFIAKEFRKRKRKIIFANTFKEINGSEILIKSGFNYYLGNNIELHKIIIDQNSFSLLRNDIEKSLKKGDKYYLIEKSL